MQGHIGTLLKHPDDFTVDANIPTDGRAYHAFEPVDINESFAIVIEFFFKERDFALGRGASLKKHQYRKKA
jgi:hypothetical protein